MVSFDATQPGTSAELWAADPRLHSRPLLQLGGVDEVVVVGAHPDDETLGAGALMAFCHESGIPVRVICVTDGSASHSNAPLLAETRLSELKNAINALAPGTPVTMLGFPDGHTREYRNEITAAMKEIFEDLSESSLLVCPWRSDGHRDHRIIGEITSEIAHGRRVLEYPVWMWHWADPNHVDTPWESMVSLPNTGDRKERAIAGFVSQTAGTPPMLHSGFLKHFHQDQEMFIVNDQILGEEYFDDVYAKSEDPWRLRSRWYEQRKRSLTLAALPHPQYQRALEIGCSNGELTAALASRCEELVAVDISEEAVAHARKRVGALADVRHLDALTNFPEGSFDLIVLSEVGYYWGDVGLEGALNMIKNHLTPGGILLACHWRHPVKDYPMNGDSVHAAIEAKDWERIAHHIEEDFVLDVYSDDGRSVARREGFL